MPAMNLLYIHQYFHTPADSGGTRSWFIAKAMHAAGMHVTIVTSDKIRRDVPLIRKETIEGLEVIYIRVAYDNTMGVAQRIASFMKFMIVSTDVCLRQRDMALVYATSTPLTVLVPALLVKWIRRTPYVFEVRDLWPEFPIQMGAVRNRALIWLLRRFEQLGYRKASHIIALSPGMQAAIDAAGHAHKTSMIPNMSKIATFYPRPVDREMMQRLGMADERLKLVYSGSLGKANGIEHLMAEALLASQRQLPFQFVVIGGGTMLAHLQKHKLDHELDNLLLLGKMSNSDVSEVVNAADVVMVSFGLQPVLETNSPNKFFDGLAAGKPILVNIGGWVRDAIETHQCGLAVDQSQPGNLLEQMQRLHDDPELRRQMGERARELAQREFDSDRLCASVLDVVEGAAHRPAETDAQRQN